MDPGEHSSAAATELGLVERAARGDAAAFGRLYRAHLDHVYRLVVFHLGHTRDADDLVQDVFLKAYQSIGTLRDPARFRFWLLKIAHNRVRNYFRGRSRCPEMEPLDTAADAASGGDGPEASAERLVELERVAVAAAQLTPLQRQVCGLRFAAGLSVAETADALGRSPGAIRNLQFHAVAALRTALRDVSENEDDRG